MRPRPAGRQAGALRPALALAAAIVAAAVTSGCTAVDDSDGAAGTVAARRQAALPPSPEAQIRPEQLLGLDGDRLTALLGPADFAREDGPARIWQFRDPQCVLDVFLYTEPGGDQFRVAHVEARNRTMPRDSDDSCVLGLLHERRARAAAAAAAG